MRSTIGLLAVVACSVSLAGCPKTSSTGTEDVDTTSASTTTTEAVATTDAVTTVPPPPGPDVRGVLDLVPSSFVSRLQGLQDAVEDQLAFKGEGDTTAMLAAAHAAETDADRLKSEVSLALDRLLGPATTSGREIPPALASTNNLLNGLYDLVTMENDLDEWHACLGLSGDCVAEGIAAQNSIDGLWPTRLVDSPAISAQFLSDARRAR